MLAICFWFLMISIADQRCWIALVSACRRFVKRAMSPSLAELQEKQQMEIRLSYLVTLKATVLIFFVKMHQTMYV